jgi:hypothetical protein
MLTVVRSGFRRSNGAVFRLFEQLFVTAILREPVRHRILGETLPAQPVLHLAAFFRDLRLRVLLSRPAFLAFGVPRSARVRPVSRRDPPHPSACKMRNVG